MTSAETLGKLPSVCLVSPCTLSERGECVQPFITTYDYYDAIKLSAHTRNYGNNKTKLTYKATGRTNSDQWVRNALCPLYPFITVVYINYVYLILEELNNRKKP